MDEKFTREKKSSRRRVEPQKQTKEKTYGSKLKNDLSRNEAMRKKLRTGKAECSETLQEKKKRDKLKNRLRKDINIFRNRPGRYSVNKRINSLS